ncbi:MAG: hypothetical protein ACRC33_01190, partial [Gemmataceae bacterium]
NILANAGPVATALTDNIGRTLVLMPAPTNAARDDVDGSYRVVRGPRPPAPAERIGPRPVATRGKPHPSRA